MLKIDKNHKLQNYIEQPNYFYYYVSVTEFIGNKEAFEDYFLSQTPFMQHVLIEKTKTGKTMHKIIELAIEQNKMNEQDVIDSLPANWVATYNVLKKGATSIQPEVVVAKEMKNNDKSKIVLYRCIDLIFSYKDKMPVILDWKSGLYSKDKARKGFNQLKTYQYLLNKNEAQLCLCFSSRTLYKKIKPVTIRGYICKKLSIYKNKIN